MGSFLLHSCLLCLFISCLLFVAIVFVLFHGPNCGLMMTTMIATIFMPKIPQNPKPSLQETNAAESIQRVLQTRASWRLSLQRTAVWQDFHWQHKVHHHINCPAISHSHKQLTGYWECSGGYPCKNPICGSRKFLHRCLQITRKSNQLYMLWLRHGTCSCNCLCQHIWISQKSNPQFAQ